MVFYLKIVQEITPDDLFDSSRALQKKRKKEKKRAESNTALTLMCAYFITPDLIRKNNLTGQGNYSQANYSFITTVHLIDLIRV